MLVGVGQVRNRPGPDGPFDPREPAELAARAVRAAAADAGHPELVAEADAVAWVPSVSWPTDEPEARLAERLGRPIPPTRIPVAPGGDAPATALIEIANRIAEGEVRIAILAGGEALHSVRRAVAEGRSLDDWAPRTSDIRKILGDQKPFSSPFERRHHIHAPIHMYPLLENAIRARAGRSVDAHQRHMARILERYSEVAERNPISWFAGERRTREDLLRVDERNRWICFPYPKLMNAIIEVDQAAAVIAMAEAEADRLGIAPERRVRFLGGARAVEGWSAVERWDLASSPAYRAAAEAACKHAGVSADRVDRFDLYSCFPSAVELALGALGLDVEDPRGFTTTGGLAHHGGPGNNYTTHALCNMTAVLRGSAGVGWVSGLGMCAAKHAICVLGSDPEGLRAADGRGSEVGLAPAEREGPPLVERPSGPARVESYTVIFDRVNRPVHAVFVIRLQDGARSLAVAEAASFPVLRLIREEGVGLVGRVEPGHGEAPNRFRLAD